LRYDELAARNKATMMQAQPQFGAQRESLWLVALYETEERIHELLERLRALGVETSEASIVRVELNDRLRVANYVPPSQSAQLSPRARNAITGALSGGTALLLIGFGLYEAGLLNLDPLAGLPAHAVVFVLIGALFGALFGALLSAPRPKPVPQAAPQTAPQVAIEIMQEAASDGYLVAVKMPPQFGEQAEAIARNLGAKQILL
jgi:hypothetical protein